MNLAAQWIVRRVARRQGVGSEESMSAHEHARRASCAGCTCRAGSASTG